MSSPCKFSLKCTNTKCTFAHPSPSAPVDFVFADSSKRIQACKFGDKCKRSDCFYSHPSPSTYKMVQQKAPVANTPVPETSSFKMNVSAPEYVPATRTDTPIPEPIPIPNEVMSSTFVGLYETYQSLVNSGLSDDEAIHQIVEQMKNMESNSFDDETLTNLVSNAIEMGEAIFDEECQREFDDLISEDSDEDGFGELDEDIQREFENFVNEGCEAIELKQ